MKSGGLYRRVLFRRQRPQASPVTQPGCINEGRTGETGFRASGRPYRVEELADLELEAVRVAGQRLRGGENLRRGRAGSLAPCIRSTLYAPRAVDLASIADHGNRDAVRFEATSRNDGSPVSLPERFRHQTNSEYGLFGFVEQLHMPFGVLLQAARNAANKVGANLGHLGPGGLAALELGSLVGSPGITTVTNSEEVLRYF